MTKQLLYYHINEQFENFININNKRNNLEINYLYLNADEGEYKQHENYPNPT